MRIPSLCRLCTLCSLCLIALANKHDRRAQLREDKHVPPHADKHDVKPSSCNQTSASSVSPAEKYLVVRVAGERFALPIRRVRGIVANVDITALPAAPPYVHGEMRLNGRSPITVIDLRRRFGVGGRADDSCIVIVEFGGETVPRQKFGLLVDGVAETATFTPINANQPETNSSTFIRGVARADDGKSVVLLDIDELLNPEARRSADHKAA